MFTPTTALRIAQVFGSLVLLVHGNVHASLLTDAAQMNPGSLTATFLAAPGLVAEGTRVAIDGFAGTALGVQSYNGGLRFSGNAADEPWHLGSNGNWTGALGFVGVDGGADPDAGVYASLVFDFGSQSVAQVAATLNFNPDTRYGGGIALPLYIAAYDAGGQLIDSYELPVWTPGATNQSLFYGIQVASPTIARFEVSGPYAVVDDLQFSSPVPEAHAAWLALAGFGVLVRLRRRPTSRTG